MEVIDLLEEYEWMLLLLLVAEIDGGTACEKHLTDGGLAVWILSLHTAPVPAAGMATFTAGLAVLIACDNAV